MAADFGRPNSGSYYYGDFSANPIFLPDSDFCVCQWVRLDSNAGSYFQYLFHAVGDGANGNIRVYTVEASNGTSELRNKWHSVTRNDSGLPQYLDNHQMAERLAVGDGKDKLVIFQRRAGLIAYHICEKGGLPVTSGGNANSNGTFTLRQVYFGIRSDLDSARSFKEKAGQLFILAGASLSDEQIQSLAVGDKTVLDVVPPAAIAAYWPLETADATALDHSGGGRHLTRIGSPANAAFSFVAEQSGGTARTLTAEGGQFVTAGHAATLRATRRLVANSAVHEHAGGAASLSARRRLAADTAQLAYDSGPADLHAARRLGAGTSALAWDGGTGRLLASRRLMVEPGVFEHGGHPATLTVSTLPPVAGDRVLIAGAATYASRGGPAALLVSRRLTAEKGAFAATGHNTQLRRRFRLGAGVGTWPVSTGAGAIRAARRLAALAGRFVTTGYGATLRHSGAPPYEMARPIIAVARPASWTAVGYERRRVAKARPQFIIATARG